MVMGLEFLQSTASVESTCLPGWMLAAAVGGPFTWALWERRRSAVKEDQAEQRAKRIEDLLDAYRDARLAANDQGHAAS